MLVARILVNLVSIPYLWIGEIRILNREVPLLCLELKRQLGEETVSLQYLTFDLLLTWSPAIGGELLEILVQL
jgi:hypothetical protein